MYVILFRQDYNDKWQVYESKFYDDQNLVACIQATLIDKYNNPNNQYNNNNVRVMVAE